MAADTVYQDAFENAKPNAAFDAVSARISLARALTEDLASYYHERAQLEEAYVKSLQKLQGRLHGTTSSTVMQSVDALQLSRAEGDKQLGAWKEVVKRLEVEVTETAKVHDTWRKKVVDDVESPLRGSLGKPKWVQWGQVYRDLSQDVKEYEITIDKLNKAQIKGASKASKSATQKTLSTQAHMSTLVSSLSSALPNFLQTSQTLDTSHSTFLKEALVRYGTLESDLGRERMEAGERLLVAVLGIDEASEMEGWALREGAKASAGGRLNSTLIAAPNDFGASRQVDAQSVRSSAPTESMAEAPITSNRQSSRVNNRDRTTSVTSRNGPPPVAPLPLPTLSPAKQGGGGFKLSSILKRDRNSVAGSSKYGNLDQSPDPSAPVNYGNAPNQVNVQRPSLDSREEVSDRYNASNAEAVFGRTSSRSSSNAGAGMQAPLEPDVRGPSAKKRESLMPFGSGSLFRRPTKMSSSTSIPLSDTRDGGRIAEDRRPAPELTKSLSPSSAAELDSEGYSVPPAGYDKQPIGGISTNLMDGDSDDENSNAPLGMPPATSVLASMAISPAKITESESDRQAALDRVKSSLGSGPAVSNLNRRATRGRRDPANRQSSLNTTHSDDVPLGQMLERQQQQRHDSTFGEESSLSTSTMTPSMRALGAVGALSAVGAASAAGASTVGSAAIKRTISPSSFSSHPDRAQSVLSTSSGPLSPTVDPFEQVSSDGLRVSIVETVNVLLKAEGIAKVLITGEVALSRKSGAQNAPLKIRIANLEQFEKAVPNATFLTSVAGSGEEFIVSPSLASAGTSTVLKYQLRVNAGTEESYLPLLTRAAWSCESGLTRLIVYYSANPLSKLATTFSEVSSPFGEDAPATLEAITFDVPISVPVHSYQAKPTAQYSPESKKLTFALDTPISLGSLLSSEPEKKMLASLSTEGTAQIQPIGVKWKVVGKSFSDIAVEVLDGTENVEEVVRSVVAGKHLVVTQ